MDTLVQAIINITAIGFVCAALLAVLGKIMYVKVDERVTRLRECMPGANCGACGYTGCDAYAVALVEGGATANQCPPGGSDLIEKISEIMGLAGGGGIVERVAVVHCCGDTESRRDKMEYTGMRTCSAASNLFGGQAACTFGCLGFGDCAAVCLTDAICMEKGLARIDTRKCNGCGLCVKACPKNVISVQVHPVPVVVMCKNTEKGGALKDKCSMGCIGCTKCVKECPQEAIKVSDFLASVDYSKCDGCKKCVESCVKKCIV